MAEAKHTTRDDIEAIREDIAALKQDLAAAVETMRNNSVSSVSGLAQQISDEASALYREVTDRSTKATQALGTKVEEQPLTSVMMAFALGYVISRITR
jgi:hypothetical protein